MTARPWMPLYVGDYLADTGHLSTLEHGAYILLIAHYWRNEGLPDDDGRLARICRLTATQWKKIKPTLQALFIDGWKHKRIEFELTESRRISDAGQKGGIASAEARRQAKVQQNQTPNSTTVERPLNDQPTNPQALQPQPQPQPLKDSPAGAETKKGKSRKRPSVVLPENWKPGDDDLKKIAELGLVPAEITRELEKFTNHARQNDRRCVDWGMAFRNWSINAAERLGRKPRDKPGATFPAMPNSPEFLSWKAYAKDSGKGGLTRLLDQRELEGRAFNFETQWPPGYKWHRPEEAA